MSKNWIYSIGLSSLITLSLHSWGGWREQTFSQVIDPPIVENQFPLADSQGWFMEESYLILKPHEDNLWYSAKLGRSGTAGDHFDLKVKKETPDFGWYSGVRVNIGRYLEHHDHWDISLSTTYYYASTEDHSNANFSKGTSLTSRWAVIPSTTMTKADVSWRLNYFTWDLSAARFYQMTSWFYIHPLVGLRAAYITQDYNSRASSAFNLVTSIQTIPIELSEKFKASNDQWGIGPRLGTNLQFNFRRHWSLLGTLTGSLLLGSYKVKESNIGKFKEHIFLNIERDRIHESAFSIKANLEAAIGLGWEKWFKNRTVRFAPSFLFEASEWFDMNHFFEIRTTPKPADIALAKKIPPSGSLGLMGFSINIQVDF